MTHFRFYFIIEIRADTENEVTALENRAAGIKVWHQCLFSVFKIAAVKKHEFWIQGKTLYHLFIIMYIIRLFMQAIMTDLKTHLYAKFGDAINLEADD